LVHLNAQNRPEKYQKGSFYFDFKPQNGVKNAVLAPFFIKNGSKHSFLAKKRPKTTLF